MKKYAVLAYVSSLLGLNLYGLLSHSYYIVSFLNMATPYLVFRAIVMLVLLAYTFIPALRFDETKALTGTLGATLLFLGVLSIFSPNFLGYSDAYVLLGDTLFFIEGGILTLLLSMELPSRRTDYLTNGIYSIKSQYLPKPPNIPYTPLPHTKTLKPHFK